MTIRFVLGTLAVLTTASASACGARSSLPVPEGTGGEGTGGEASQERICPSNCTIGHQCCIGGCDGPPAVMENDCCHCVNGEVNSNQCGGTCGGEP